MSGILMSLSGVNADSRVPIVPPYVPPLYVEAGIVMYYNPADPSSYPGAGATITDLAGNNLHGTISGTPTYNSNGWFSLDASDDSIVTSNISSAKGTANSHTIETWVRPTRECAIFTDQDTVTPMSGYYSTGSEMWPVGPFHLIGSTMWQGSLTDRAVAATHSMNQWAQLVRVYNGTQITSYRNGVAGTPAAISWSPPSNWFLGIGMPSTTTGRFFANGGRFGGDIGIVRVYNRPLSNTEVLSNYNGAKSIYGL